jgi:hypothetical protein
LFRAIDKNSTADDSGFGKMIFAFEYKVVFLDYENITRNKKYFG